MEPASGAAEAGVGRSLSPSVVRPCAWHAGSTAAWGPDCAAVTWGAHARLRWAGAIGCAGAAGRTRYACRYRRAHARQLWWAPARRPAANPAAQPRSQQTPLARPTTWAFFTTPSRAVARLDLRTLPAALLKLALGRTQPETPMPNVTKRDSIFSRWDRSAGKPSIHNAHAAHIPHAYGIIYATGVSLR